MPRERSECIGYSLVQVLGGVAVVVADRAQGCMPRERSECVGYTLVQVLGRAQGCMPRERSECTPLYNVYKQAEYLLNEMHCTREPRAR